MILSNDFLSYFSELEDPRFTKHGNFLYDFSEILTITILAVICGADNWVEVADFGNCRKNWLNSFLKLANGIPSHDTFGRVFANLDAERFEKCFIKWSKSLSLILDKKTHIAIDGKTSRRSYNKKKKQLPLHMVSAWASEQGLLLGQVSIKEKSNEIEAIPRLLEMIDIKDAIITIDAMGCQREIAAEIASRKGDYILNLKDNQPSLSQGVQAIFTRADDTTFKGMHYLQKIEKVKEHGRIERRQYALISCKDNWIFQTTWPGLRSIGRCIVKRTINYQTSYSIRYFLTSLTYEQINDFMRASRKHWDIEINLHWSLDVSFNDDLNRARTKNAQENLSIIKRIALNMLKQEKQSKIGISAKRKKAAWDNEFLYKVINNDKLEN